MTPAMTTTSDAFACWLDRSRQRFDDASFREIRKGVQALSRQYLHREGGRCGAITHRHRQAAFVTYYAPLHFLTVRGALDRITSGSPARIIDLGCGSGAVSAAIGGSLPSPPRLLGIDPAEWALRAARDRWQACGLSGRTQRGSLPGAFPRVRGGDLLAAGWCLNELDDDARAAVLGRTRGALRRGAGLLIVETAGSRLVPWWGDWREALEPLGATDTRVGFELDRPEWIRRMDKAAGLDHRRLSARLLWRAPA